MPHSDATNNVHTIEGFAPTDIAHIDSILSGFRYTSEADGSYSVTYSIPGENATFNDHYIRDEKELSDSFFPVPNELVGYLHKAIAEIKSFTNLKLNEVIEDGAQFGEIRLAATKDLPDNVGAMVFRRTDSLHLNQTGDIWFDDRAFTDGFDGGSDGQLQRGIFHELGHALGLNHSNEGFQTEAGNGVKMPAEFDGDEYSVMDAEFATVLFDNAINSDLEPGSYGYLDILALQSLYGVNETATGGNQVYSFDLSERHAKTIYDLGGTDGIVITGTSGTKAGDSVAIDLSIASDSLGGRFIDVGTEVKYFAQSGVVIGLNSKTIYVTPETVIENVTGADGDDLIRGNEATNALVGKGGADKLYGMAGNDVLVGNAGQDTMEGGAGDDALWAGAGDDDGDLSSGGAGDDTLGGAVGDDTLSGGEGHDILFGGSGADFLVAGELLNGVAGTAETSSNNIWAGDGNDIVIGANGHDNLGGGLGNDAIKGHAGNDLIYAGKSGNDTLEGGEGNDKIFASIGDDQVGGGAGKDTLFGGAGNDAVSGGAGNDLIYAGAGTDTIMGGLDADSLYAGDGSDTFAFETGHGDDALFDFDITQDILNLAATGTDFTDMASVEAASTATSVGNKTGVLIDTGAGDSIFLAGLTLADLGVLNASF